MFIAFSHLFACPPDHPQSELRDMAAFGLAFILT
jgi:hypothetical protein